MPNILGNQIVPVVVLEAQLDFIEVRKVFTYFKYILQGLPHLLLILTKVAG